MRTRDNNEAKDTTGCAGKHNSVMNRVYDVDIVGSRETVAKYQMLLQFRLFESIDQQWAEALKLTLDGIYV